MAEPDPTINRPIAGKGDLTAIARAAFAIRPAVYRDARAVVRLAEICFGRQAAYDNTMPGIGFMQNRIAMDDGPTFVATAGDRIIGYAMMDIDRQTAEKTAACLSSIGVDPVYRGRHVGRALIEGAEEEVLFLGRGTACEITAHIHFRNAASHALFESAGYEICGAIPRYYQDYGRADLLRKTLG